MSTAKPVGVNPKDLVGNTKVSITKFPVIGTIMGSMAMMDGAAKYGPYNWRENKVIASIYIDALLRHTFAWFEGQEKASDSKVHHLGHAIACCTILLDAMATGNLVDDRPVTRNEDGTAVDPDWLPNLLEELSAVIKAKKEEKAAKNAEPAKHRTARKTASGLRASKAKSHKRLSA